MIADLQKSKAQILLERGRKVTAKDILLFIADLLKGNPADKDYQRKIIDNLVFAVYIYDDERIKTVGYLNLGVDESIEKIRLDETNEVVERLKACSNSNILTPPKKADFYAKNPLFSLKKRQNSRFFLFCPSLAPQKFPMLSHLRIYVRIWKNDVVKIPENRDTQIFDRVMHTTKNP